MGRPMSQNHGEGIRTMDFDHRDGCGYRGGQKGSRSGPVTVAWHARFDHSRIIGMAG